MNELQRFIADLPNQVVSLIIRVALALLVGWFGYWLTRRAQKAADLFLQRTRPQEADVLARAVRRIIAIAGIVLAAALALAFMGVDLTALVASLGLTSIALGFALKDTIEQAITGMILLFQRPFKVGDVIEVEGIEGTVVDVAIRTTIIRTFDGLQVLIPNNKVYQGIIRNKSYYTSRRYLLTIGIAYVSDLRKAHSTILDAVQATPGVLADPASTVSFEGFDSSTIRALVRFWIEPEKNDALTMQTEVTRSIMAAAQREGIEIPFPIQTLVVKQGDSQSNSSVPLSQVRASSSKGT